jgi:hypothetical protein
MAHWTALVTVLTVLFYFFLGTQMGAARGKYGIKLPATSGHPEFDRIARVHGNTAIASRCRRARRPRPLVQLQHATQSAHRGHADDEIGLVGVVLEAGNLIDREA